MKNKKMVFATLMLLVSLFAPSVINAASEGFSFNFDMLYLNGSSNNVYYNIGGNKTVTAEGSWRLYRTEDTIDAPEINETLYVQLKKEALFGDAEFGLKCIGTNTLYRGYNRSETADFSVSWTSGSSSNKYYLETHAYTKFVTKLGSGTLSW